MKNHALKRLVLFLIVFLTISPISLNSENTFNEQSLSQQSFDREIINAIQTANGNILAKHFFSNIELNIPGVQGNFSKTQAEFILKNFFKNNPPSSFNIINEGVSGGEKSRFFLGNYLSTNGNSFRVYYLCKEINGKNLITILKFE